MAAEADGTELVPLAKANDHPLCERGPMRKRSPGNFIDRQWEWSGLWIKAAVRLVGQRLR